MTLSRGFFMSTFYQTASVKNFDSVGSDTLDKVPWVTINCSPTAII